MIKLSLIVYLIPFLCMGSVCLENNLDAETLCHDSFHLDSDDPEYDACRTEMNNLIKNVNSSKEYLELTKICANIPFDWKKSKDFIDSFYNKKWSADMIRDLIMTGRLRGADETIAKINVNFWNKIYSKNDWELKNTIFQYALEIAESEQYRNALESYLALDNDSNKDFIKKCRTGVILGLSAGLHDRNLNLEDLITLYRSACFPVKHDGPNEYFEWTMYILKETFSYKTIHDASLNRISFLLKYGLPLAEELYFSNERSSGAWALDQLPAFAYIPDKVKPTEDEIQKFQEEQSIFTKVMTSGIHFSIYKNIKKIAETANIPTDFMYDFIINSKYVDLEEIIYLDTFRFLIQVYNRNPEMYKKLEDFTVILFDEQSDDTKPASVLKLANEHNMDMKQTYAFMKTVCYKFSQYKMLDSYDRLTKLGIDNIFEILAEKSLHNIYDYIDVSEDKDLQSNKDLVRYFFQCDINFDCSSRTLKLIVKFNDKQSRKMDKNSACYLFKLTCPQKMNAHYTEMQDIFNNQDYMAVVNNIISLSSKIVDNENDKSNYYRF